MSSCQQAWPGDVREIRLTRRPDVSLLSPLSSLLPATVQSVSATSEETEMAGLLLGVLLSVLGVLQCVPPRSREQCSLPLTWEDIWTEARDGAQVSPSGGLTLTLSLLIGIQS